MCSQHILSHHAHNIGSQQMLATCAHSRSSPQCAHNRISLLLPTILAHNRCRHFSHNRSSQPCAHDGFSFLVLTISTQNSCSTLVLTTGVSQCAHNRFPLLVLTISAHSRCSPLVLTSGAHHNVLTTDSHILCFMFTGFHEISIHSILQASGERWSHTACKANRLAHNWVTRCEYKDRVTVFYFLWRPSTPNRHPCPNWQSCSNCWQLGRALVLSMRNLPKR